MIFGLDFEWLADPLYQSWLFEGLKTTLAITALGTILMLIIGIAGAAIIHFNVPVARSLTIIMIDLFRNTPPLVQLFFLYFMLSDLGMSYTDSATGEQVPLLSGFACVVISLALYNGSIAIEIIRSGINSVPLQTVEGGRSMGYSRLQIFRWIELPIALRMTIPNMTSNVVSLIKTSAQAALVAVTDIMFFSTQIALETFLNLEVMIVLWLTYLAITTLVVLLAKQIAKAFAIPGFGAGEVQ
ncbi:amino acid ABC transporter permease [Pseudochrobactrum sp. sp1633]|uniref:amino acid ABC transporter permease n=1 Tax=Pseudochrobactrum sp. sp1633 TaxID=3036706 RepID=UPI0025A4D4A0|nr:amino acid ABC transporter permease [Pseudochrobactrum sp. sp1633]MDM8346593.1 amino acid ABC transporter permease [Pseudochrobactrum sp. sp1633]HWD12633.1 amino acid ABC transporter permease [Pseudochrobactrum sp.]